MDQCANVSICQPVCAHGATDWHISRMGLFIVPFRFSHHRLLFCVKRVGYRLKMQRTGFLDYQLLSAAPTGFILLSDQHLYGKFPLFRHAELQQREERGRICASGRIYDHYFPPPFQKPLWCARIRMDTGKETGRNPGRPAAHQNANH